MRTHDEQLEARRAVIRLRIADGYYEHDSVIDIAAEMMAADLGLSQSGSGRTGDVLPAGLGGGSFPPSGDSAGALTDSRPRLAVGEPMLVVDVPPVMLGPEGTYREADEIAGQWQRFNDRSNALLFWLTVVFFFALCIGGVIWQG